jgi:UDP-N-acetylmuramoyl-tripeptide--D-alanyl-D-alanine ligase
MSMGGLATVAGAVGGTLVGGDCSFNAVSTDTRTLQPRDLFFALRGERFDAGEFVLAAAAAGAAGAVVEKRQACDLSQVEVTDTRAALGAFAKYWRARFRIPVIAVTGSNGKTTVKEMISSILTAYTESKLDVLVTSGNLNNEIGLPLMVLRLRESHRMAVLEMGASHKGDIDYLADIASADIGVVTNAGPAHLEGFGGLDGVAAGKGELFSSLDKDGVAVVNRDDRYFEFWRSLCANCGIVTFGLHVDADWRAENVRELDDGGQNALEIEISSPAGVFPVYLPMAGRHNVMNALAAAAATFNAGVPVDVITQGLASLRNVPGRLKPVSGHSGIVLYDDSYNANPASVQAAIDFLASRPGETWLVFGDMAELGQNSPGLHEEVGTAACAAGIDRMFCVGDCSRAAADSFGAGAQWFADRDLLTQTLLSELHPQISILVKGSRCMGLEAIVDALQIATVADQGNLPR